MIIILHEETVKYLLPNSLGYAYACQDCTGMSGQGHKQATQRREESKGQAFYVCEREIGGGGDWVHTRDWKEQGTEDDRHLAACFFHHEF